MSFLTMTMSLPDDVAMDGSASLPAICLLAAVEPLLILLLWQ
ncbi:hypothetical protein Syncc8109_1419 [Synechococcus sp. WH 8109]|nr:hypothetical protein [Synechococcus sp. WH 8109]AHF63781.1 hypothetical protein Syncc8109_1419 [Synechococcus sp. WH 8109]